MIKISVYIISLCLLSNCSFLAKREAKNLKEKPQVSQVAEPIRLHLKAKKGDRFHHQYYVKTVTRTYDEESIAREKEEITDFKVRQRVEESKNGNILYIVEVLEKNGVMDLHDLVMPYIGEKLKVRLNPFGKVLEVEGYEKDSAFYLSPLSLPDEPVKVGATWTLTEEWKSEKNSLPMRIDLLSILKNLYSYNNRLYADIETSGEIQVPSILQKKINFQSLVKGRVLLDVESGNVVWSEIRNKEEINYPGIKIVVKSCMELNATKPGFLKWPWAMKPQCDPKKDFIPSVPGV